MGLSGVGGWQLLVVLLIVLVLFGGKRLRKSGADLGGALRDFKRAVSADRNMPDSRD